MAFAICFAGGCAAPVESVEEERPAAYGVVRNLYPPIVEVTEETPDHLTDWAYLTSRLNTILEFERTGASVPWENPATGRDGQVEIQRTYKLGDGTPCRRFIRTLRDTDKHYALDSTACRLREGDWRLLDAKDMAEIAESDARPKAWKTAHSASDELAEAALAGLDPSDYRACLPEAPGDAGDPSGLDLGQIDLVFLIDTTGSMKEELESLRPRILDLVRGLAGRSESLQVGIVAFRDRPDSYLTKVFSLVPATEDRIAELEAFLTALEAKGGGDYDEPVHIALAAATGLTWRAEALGRLVLISDSRVTHHRVSEALDLARRFHETAPEGPNQRQVLSIFSGRNTAGRKFHQALTKAGGGALAFRAEETEACVLASLGAAGGD